MKNRREEMRNVWCNDGSGKYDQDGNMQDLPPYQQSKSLSSPPPSGSSISSPPHHSTFNPHGFSLIPSLNMASLDKDDIAEESRDSESPISDVEITDD